MNPNVGSIEYDARITTSRMKADSKEADAIAAKTGQNIGSSIEKGESRASAALSKMTSFAKAAAVTTAAAFTAAIGKFVLAGGISRALNIEDAQAKLKGLGHDAQSVAAIMDSALKSVKGTAFGLDAAATAAASAVAAGVKPGKELTRVLSLTGDTATIMGREFNEAGAIINKVLAGNRLSMEEVNQLSDAGLPILSMLGKEYGKTAGEMREMVSNGEVDSAKFLKALEKNIGGAALASGNTTRGAWNNMQAAMSRVGAAIVKDIIPRVREAFGSMAKWFDDNSNRIVASVRGTIQVMKNLAGQVVAIGRSVAEYLQPKLTALWNTLSSQVLPVLTRLWKEVIVPLAPVIGTILVGAIGLAVDILNGLLRVLTPVINFMLDNKPVVIGLAVAFGTLQAALHFGAGVAAFKGAMAAIRLSALSTYATITAPIALPALAIGAVLGSLAMIAAKAIETRNILRETTASIENSINARVNAAKQLIAMTKAPFGPEVQARARRSLRAMEIPGYARGTNFAPGGLSLVGERGPEIIDLPRGSRVIPNDSIGASSGRNVNITLNMSGIMARSKSDERDIAKSLLARINEELGAKGQPLLGGGTL